MTAWVCYTKSMNCSSVVFDKGGSGSINVIVDENCFQRILRVCLDLMGVCGAPGSCALSSLCLCIACSTSGAEQWLWILHHIQAGQYREVKRGNNISISDFIWAAKVWKKFRSVFKIILLTVNDWDMQIMWTSDKAQMNWNICSSDSARGNWWKIVFRTGLDKTLENVWKH